MIMGVTYRTKNLTEWNENRRGEIELDALARVYLSDVQITDRDRIAFALREPAMQNVTRSQKRTGSTSGVNRPMADDERCRRINVQE